ncbi:hypothetical protein NLU13_0280 [Sarocladium strictum]|uniref:Protein kinase domain-containing protein n=1 Tax=Sarocladium strictum TaxID=5046 RepID=A0AA39GRI9_SARSR|nr:hypothetical protein NLU13_0280 [Sarocladium strictum]
MEDAFQFADRVNAQVECLSEVTGQRRPRYNLIALIAKGPSGHVFRARNATSRDVVAIKIIDTNDRDWVSREGDTLWQIKKDIRRINSSSDYGHFGLLETLEVIPFLDTLWMVSPLCRGGSLKALMAPRGHLTETYIISALRDVARGLYWLHSQGTFHGNVKSANILINEKGSLRLCDFDLVSRGEISPSHSQSAYNGSLHWLAPECLIDRYGFHKGVDIWSFGALAFELATGQPPNVCLESEAAILNHLEQVGPPALTGDQYSDSLKDLVSYCCVIDPGQRPSMDLLFFTHPYLSSTSESASLKVLMDEYQVWECQQLADSSEEAKVPADVLRMLGVGTQAASSNLGVGANSLFQANNYSLPEAESANPRNNDISDFSLDGLPSDLEGDLGVWSVVDEPSRCSSPFDLEHLILPTRTISFEDLNAVASPDRQIQDREWKPVGSCDISSAGAGDELGGVPITIGMSLPRDRPHLLNPSKTMSNADNGGLETDFDVSFNPDFDVFASDSVTSTSSSSMLGAAPRNNNLLDLDASPGTVTTNFPFFVSH